MTPKRLPLAHLPTPIHKLERLSTEVGHEIFVWRDDLTGCVESGNKIRKLEYLLADAVDQGATAIVTCGAPQSNHARATVWSARRLGMEASVVIREPPEGLDTSGGDTGNWFLNRMAGASMVFVPFKEYRAAGSRYDTFLAAEADRLCEQGHVPYIIEEGGSSPLGCFGYLHAVGEMLDTWTNLGLPDDGPDALFLALGSGGTHAGLVLGYDAHGLDTSRVCAVNVCNSEPYFKQRVGRLIEQTCKQFDITPPPPELHIFDGHAGGGYAQATDDDLAFYCKLARMEGILLDPCYTGKGFQGMLRELEMSPGRFGQRILFLHSGGVFSNTAYAAQYTSVMEKHVQGTSP